jgi:hypothetical protein
MAMGSGTAAPVDIENPFHDRPFGVGENAGCLRMVVSNGRPINPNR